MLPRAESPLHRLLLALLGLTLATSAFVFPEPAPYDALSMLLVVPAIVLGMLAYPPSFAVPVLSVAVFLSGNVASVLLTRPEVLAGYANHAIGYFLVTCYLAVSFLLFAGFLGAYGLRAMRLILGGVSIAGSIASGLGIAAFFGLIPMFGRLVVVGRVTGTFKDPNVYGPFLVPVLIYALVRMEETTGRQRLVWIVTFVLNLAGVILCYSRAAWGNTVLSIGLYLLLRTISSRDMRQVRSILGKSVVTAVIMVLVGGYLVSRPEVSELFYQRLSYQHYDTERFGTQATALESAAHAPFGVGPGLAESAFGMATHSLYVRVLVENGFLGLAAMIVLLLTSLGRAVRLTLHADPVRQRYFALAAAALAGMMFTSFFVDTLHWRHFWIVLSLGWLQASPQRSRMTPDAMPRNRMR